MRFQQKLQTILSEDEISQPKRIQFIDDREIVEQGVSTSLKDGGGRTETVPSSSVYVLPMGKIATGKWFYLVGSVDFTLKIDGGQSLQVAANHPSSMWVSFSSLEVTVAGVDLRLTWAIAGD